MDFPTLGDGSFPHIDNVDVYQYKNEYDYSRFDADQAHITVCHVPWDVGLVHVGDRFIEGLGNVVKFASETKRNAYISGLSDKFEFDTKYRRYHLELEIKLPLPVDRCAEYNYVVVHHEPMPNASDPVEYESVAEGVKDWFFFIRELKYLAPNTTYAVLMLDVWQTFIYRFGISGVMLERGHYPVSQSDVDGYLSDPMGNSAYLLDTDIDAPESMVNASDDVHVFDDDVLFALFTSFDFAGSYGVKHQNGWNAPSIGIVGKSGYPSQTCIAVETTDVQSLLDYMQTYIPQSLECIQACAFVPRELVEVSGTFILGTLTVYNLKSKKSTVTHELVRGDFAYPEEYAELAKLYTAPYASIVITDGKDSITIAPQTVSGDSIEIITDLQLIADALRMRSQTVHVGGSNISLGFERLTSKTFTASGSMQDLSILRDIPTYAIYIDNSIIYDNDNYWLNEQRKAEAAARLADATDSATATKADAYASAQASKDNAYASALASKDNAYASALASKDNAYASAQTANANAYEQAQAQNMIELADAATVKADAVANAYAALNDTKNSADTAKTNADAAALADKQNADASAWAEQTNSNASALADKQNADSNAWAEQTNSNASALADYTNRNSSAFAVKTDADEEGNTKNANAALNVAANSLINSYATTDATTQANHNISYNGVALAQDNAYTSDTANAQSDAQIQSAAVSVAGNAIGAAATGAMAGSVIPGVGTVAGAVAGIISAIPNAAEVAANTAIGVNLSLTQAQLAIANASAKESYANVTMTAKTATSNNYSTLSTDAGNNLIADTTANEAALIQANAARDYACDIDNSQRTYDTEVANAGNVYSAETSNAQNTYDTLVANATNTYSAETSNAQNTYDTRTQSNTRDNDTAHAIADRDYSIAIGIANRDNTTSVDNADLAKLTAESIADRSQATDNANADRSYNAATANADRSYNAATANADRSYNTATANADRDYNTAIGIAQRDNTVQLASIDADIAQAALKAPYAVCAGSVQDAGAETPNYLDIQIRTMQPSDIRRIGDEFLRHGYAYHGYVSDPDFTIMPRFTFWQCSEIFISNLSIPDAYADQIRYLLIGGVTVWSDPSFIGNTSIYDNVIGG